MLPTQTKRCHQLWKGPEAQSILETCQTESEILMIFCDFLAASAAKNYEKKAVIQSAASAASTQGGCASSRLDHGLKFYVIPGGCAGSRLISEFLDCVHFVLAAVFARERDAHPHTCRQVE